MQTQRNKSESAPEPEGEGAVRSSAVLAELEAARRHLCNAMDTHPSKWNSVYDWNETADMLAVIDDIVESERRHSANRADQRRRTKDFMNTKTEQSRSLHPRGVRRRKPQPKPQTAWAIYTGRVMLPWSIRATKTEAIDKLEATLEWTWRDLQAHGYSIAKVIVQPVCSSHTEPRSGAAGRGAS